MRTWRGGSALAAALLALGVLAIPASAATSVYPSGAGQFDGGAEGWQVTEASCNVPLLCSASGGYEPGDGRPAGSLAANTNVALNLLTLFQSTVTLRSPDFKVGDGGAGSLHLDRRFASGSLVDLAPQFDYTAQLTDRTSDKVSTSITESVEGSSGWSGADGAVTLATGHTYAIVITVRTSSTVAGTGLLAGSTSARFDNVALTVGSGGSDGGGKGDGTGRGAGSSIAARVTALAPATLAGPARLKGQRLSVKARCPAKIGRACRISVLGLLSKRKPATATRRVKVAKGKTKRVVLKVKPRAKGRVAVRKRLLFKVKVRAGSADATAFKRLRLLRR
ncbi:MAG TPA: hypothetical protein VFS54_05435 [Solirubrobacterales bacterium]|nr:hypothetical protein [Solirubrobacterales bacterium]